MKELSLHILDIAQNSISAGCTRLELSLTEGEGQLVLVIGDNGRGMSPEFPGLRHRPLYHHPHHPQGGAGAAPSPPDGGTDRRQPDH